MSNILNGHFHNPSIGNLEFNQVIDEIFNYIDKKPECFYDIIVGCDSSSQEHPQFPVAIVVLRVGEGGRIFLKKIRYGDRKFYSLKERILEEVLISCELSLELKDALNAKIQELKKDYNYQFRYIHADIGENGDTKNMIKEVVGLIKGNGFEAKIKPEAYAASTVADRYT
ncbi:MAG: ribonuclease H-like YkuK family protein [Patescibacteria group bacterium]|nr:ribonuclease H-like YkuK family protein [Patescibacteria group bacterium]